MFSYGFPRHWSTLRKLLWLKLLQGAVAVLQTVTGNAPLTLANAIARSIKSLTQTGLCTQDDTPTPSTPVPIKCNNGVLTMVDDELPTGYKRLIGITFDGNIRYETGEYLTGDDDVTMTLDNLSSSGKNVFGSYNGANDKNFSLYIYGSTNGSYFRYGNQLKRPKYGSTGRRTITFGASGTSGFAENSTVDPDEFTTPANACIGMLPNSSSSAFMGDIVGSILVSNRLEWIPCERESDGVVGYYEAVKGVFLEPVGTGTPVSLGYDTSHLVLRVVGTPETLTVGGNLLSRDGETTGKIIADDGTVSDNANYCISAPFTLSAGNYVCTWKTGSGSRPFSVFAVDESGTPQSDGKLFYKQSSASGINTGEFTVAAQTRAVASYRSNATDLAIYSPQQTASVVDLLSVGSYADTHELIGGVVTRKCGIKILTGEEIGWALSDSGTTHRFRGTKPDDCYTPSGRAPILSSHFVYVATGQGQGGAFIGASQYWYFIPTDQTIDTADKWKTWLAEQYAAGTPVIIVYPLAEATTESVAGQSLSTAEGTNVVSVTAEVSPVALTCEYYQSAA